VVEIVLLPRWTRKNPAVRRIEILEAAERLLIEYGSDRYSLAAIAEEAGLSKSAIYMHFESREELFRAFTQHVLEDPMLRAQEESKSGGTLEGRVFRVLDAKIGHFYRVSRESQYGGWLIELTNQLSADLLEKDRRGYVGLLGRVLQEAQDDGEVDSGLAGLSSATLASTLISAAHGLARDDARFVSERVFTQRLRALVRMSMRGLYPEP
jgi:AcrR family transcriptional regulator